MAIKEEDLSRYLKEEDLSAYSPVSKKHSLFQQIGNIPSAMAKGALSTPSAIAHLPEAIPNLIKSIQGEEGRTAPESPNLLKKVQRITDFIARIGPEPKGKIEKTAEFIGSIASPESFSGISKISKGIISPLKVAGERVGFEKGKLLDELGQTRIDNQRIIKAFDEAKSRLSDKFKTLKKSEKKKLDNLKDDAKFVDTTEYAQRLKELLDDNAKWMETNKKLSEKRANYISVVRDIRGSINDIIRESHPELAKANDKYSYWIDNITKANKALNTSEISRSLKLPYNVYKIPAIESAINVPIKSAAYPFRISQGIAKTRIPQISQLTGGNE